MNRVTSPVNIASLIFIILTCLTINGISKSERRAEREKVQSELVAHYQSDYKEILDAAAAKLPMQLNDYLVPYVDQLRLEGDTLNVICHIDNDYQHLFENSSTAPAMSLLTMFKDGGFGPAFVDCVMANQWSIRMINSHNGVIFEDYTFGYGDLVEGYLHHYYKDTPEAARAGEKIALKGWVAAQNK